VNVVEKPMLRMILSPRVSLPQDMEEGYLLSTLYCDSEACVKNKGERGRERDLRCAQPHDSFIRFYCCG